MYYVNGLVRSLRASGSAAACPIIKIRKPCDALVSSVVTIEMRHILSRALTGLCGICAFGGGASGIAHPFRKPVPTFRDALLRYRAFEAKAERKMSMMVSGSVRCSASGIHPMRKHKGTLPPSGLDAGCSALETFEKLRKENGNEFF